MGAIGLIATARMRAAACHRALRPAHPHPSLRAMKLLDPDHPMFRRAWVRWATALVPLAWAAVELATGNPGWALMFGAAGAYALWVLVIARRDPG